MVEKNGLQSTNLTTDFTFTKTNMLFNKTVLETKTSKIYADISFSYKREELKFFNDKVNINAIFSNSRVSLEDLSNFYGEFGIDDVLNLNGNLVGTLNNFKVKQLDINSDQGVIINGDFTKLTG